jgi:hypothetical protein
MLSLSSIVQLPWLRVHCFPLCEQLVRKHTNVHTNPLTHAHTHTHSFSVKFEHLTGHKHTHHTSCFVNDQISTHSPCPYMPVHAYFCTFVRAFILLFVHPNTVLHPMYVLQQHTRTHTHTHMHLTCSFDEDMPIYLHFHKHTHKHIPTFNLFFHGYAHIYVNDVFRV